MKTHLNAFVRLLLVPVVLAAGPAHATIFGDQIGGSSLIFEAWDGVSKEGFVQNVGPIFDDFLTGNAATITLNLDATSWNTLLGSDTSGTALQWHIFATKANPTTISGDGVLTTIAPGGLPSAALDVFSMTTLELSLGSHIGQDVLAVTGTSNFGTMASTNAAYGGLVGTDYFGNLVAGKSVKTGFGSIDFYSIASDTATNSFRVDTKQPNQFSLATNGTLTYGPPPTAPVIGSLPTLLTFGNQNVGITSANQPVSVTNIGTAPLTLGNIATSGDFGQANNCSGAIAPSANCAISVAFTPTAAGTRNGTLTFTSNAAGSPHSVNLTGTGVAVVLTPQTISFGPLPSRPLGLGLTLAATASSGLQVSFSSLTAGVCTISANVVVPIATGTCTVAADQAGDATYAGATQVTQSFKVVSVKSDLNGDGKADVFWRNTSPSGQNYAWLMNGVNLSAQNYLPVVADSNWKVAGIGDMDGDGRSDVFWRNTSTGETYAWLMNGLNVSAAGGLPTIDLAWHIQDVADVDGDGKADVLWRNTTTGETYLWLMNGMSVASSGFLPIVADKNWQVQGMADVDGDGKADVVWHNTSTGENYVWLMNGLSLTGSGFLPPVTDLNWKVLGLADIDGDGLADVLWHNDMTHETYVWLMNGLSIKAGAYLPTVTDANWHIQGMADVDGDGKADVLWQNTSTGETYAWLMNGMSIKAGGYLPTVADTAWKMQPVWQQQP